MLTHFPHLGGCPCWHFVFTIFVMRSNNLVDPSLVWVTISTTMLICTCFATMADCFSLLREVLLAVQAAHVSHYQNYSALLMFTLNLMAPILFQEIVLNVCHLANFYHSARGPCHHRCDAGVDQGASLHPICWCSLSVAPGLEWLSSFLHGTGEPHTS